MLAYRTSVHETTGETPFHLMFGREVRLPIDVMYGTPTSHPPPSISQYAQTLRNRLESAYSHVRSRTKLMQRRQKDAYDQNLEGSSYQVGDLVWLHCPASPRGRSRKFHRPWQGPFEVVKLINDVVYRIRCCSSPRRRLVVHFNRLKPYAGQPSPVLPPITTPAPTQVCHRSHSPPAPVLMPGDDENSGPASDAVTEDTRDDAIAGDTRDEQDRATSGTTEPPFQPRRSTRLRQPPDRYGDFVSH